MSGFDILQPPALSPSIHHRALNTTFSGVEPAPPPTCSSAARVHQYFGITYATIPARFRQSVLCSTYPETTDASKHGPICPQPNRRRKTEELLLGVPPEDLPVQDLKQDEFACLNLNITCPAGLTPRSRVPVMIWIHGGGDRGSGSDWLYDGANLVRKSIDYDKPIILVSINFRLGLLGFAASPSLREDNQAAGDEGVGNYGLRDQRVAMEWVHRYIGEFGGDPNNITLCGSGSGAADVLCHLLSRANETNPLFHRAISQSAIFEPIVPDVSNAGWQLSRIMSALQVTSVDKFRSIEAQKLLGLGQTIRAVNDGVFFRDDWHDWFSPETAHAHSHHKEQLPHAAPGRAHHGPSQGVGANLHPPASPRRSRSRSARPSKSKSLNSRSRSRATFSNLSVSSVLSDQPLLIGDNCCDSLLWSIPISLWTSAGVVRRLKAICQSLSKTSSLLRYYDLSSSTPDHEVIEHVLELVNDARVAWPTQIFADHARHVRGDRNVWRYVFDQEGPIRGLPHHAAELIYLFDNCPLPEHIVNPAGSSSSSLDAMEWDGEGPFYDLSDDEDGAEPPKYDPVTFRTTNGTAAVAASASAAASSSMAGGASPDLSSSGSEEDDWCLAVVDEYSYRKVKDTIQERWISFIHGESPWREDKIFVFGPEGETGERSKGIFEGRRRKNVWKEVFEPLGAQLVQKVGVELSRGPAPGHA